MNQSIHALTLAPDVNDWLANSRHPRILHVFDLACNLINEHGDVLSVVTRQIGSGPFNLVVDDDICFSEHLSLESPVSVSHAHLTLDNLTIPTEDAKLWNPHPDWEKLHVRKHDICHQLTQLPTLAPPGTVRHYSPRSGVEWEDRCGASAGVTNYLNFAGFDIPIGEPSRLLNHQDLLTTQSPVSSLSSSLAIADLPSSLTAAQQLAGLGAGLTPAGDDFMMGAMYAVWIIHPCDIARILAREVSNIAAPLTTSLSAAWLKSAGKGEAGILWHRFFDALLADRNSKPTYIQEAIDKILAVGETSGADALMGFFGTMIASLESKSTGPPE